MVVDISEPGESRIAGFIPVGWYPTALAVSPDSRTLLAANGKGLRSQPSYPPRVPRKAAHGVAFDHPGKLFEGSIAAIPRPDAAALARYTQQVKQNSPYTPQTMHRAVAKSDCCIPDKTGGDCPIKYVLYIIKENRTYDQVLRRFQGRPRPPGGQRRSGAGDVRRERHAQPPPVGPRLRAAGQFLLQRRSERRRPRLVRRRDRHRLQAAGLDHELFGPRRPCPATTKWPRRRPAICGTIAAATA